MRPRKLPDGESADPVEKATDIIALRHLLERAPSPLSSSWRQRVTLARRPWRPPAVFLFDEPLRNTAGKQRDEVQSEIVGRDVLDVCTGASPPQSST